MNAVKIPNILLPNDGVDLSAWAVNACDQYTSDYNYWQNVQNITQDKPSTYDLIFPEIYLKDRPEERIARINEKMREYLAGGVFKEITGGLILVERTTESGTRTGLVLAIDLEDYSFRPDAKTLIRSTEATILERIPPRVEIRRNAEIELPHAMLLYDDEDNAILKSVKRGKILYDFDLMCGGGHVKGTYVENSEDIVNKFYALLSDERLQKKYGGEKLLFAVGDGNHSLATAKTCWENLKPILESSGADTKTHPARYALCEVVNIYDKALAFEPIHRFIKTDNAELFAKNFKTKGGAKAYIVINGKKREIPFNKDIPQGIRELDEYITAFVKANGGEIDYIHGEEDLISLTRSGVGVLLPAIEKSDFFRLIVSGGNLPRKTFSMGEGNEKRYYIEAKKIK